MFKLSEFVETIQINACDLNTGHFEVLKFSKIGAQKVKCCCGQLIFLEKF